MKHVRSIEFVFENCEYFEIESKYFGGVQFEDIRCSIARIACNSISKLYTVYSVVLEIFASANIDYSPFGSTSETQKKFDRIMNWNDITSFIIKYDDNSEEDYYVDYDDKNDSLGAENKNQKVYLSKQGNLYIVIEKNKDVLDFFDKEEIDDKEVVDAFERMISN
jgi:hypothetical protein